MDRIQELLSNVTSLSDDELNELRDLVMAELDPQAPAEGAPAEEVPFSTERLEELANAATAVRNEFSRRKDDAAKRAELAARLAEFRGDTLVNPAPAPTPTPIPAPAPVAPVEAAVVAPPVVPVVPVAPVTPEVPADRTPNRPVGGATVITAGADLPNIALGGEFQSMHDLAKAFSGRITAMRGLRGADGDKVKVATAKLGGEFAEGGSRYLSSTDGEANLARVNAVMTPQAIVAAGGLGAPEEAKYDFFGAGDDDRPVRDSLPVFTADRGGVRFMRPPTLNDVDGVVGIWTVQNDIDAVTNPAIRKPSFRVAPGPEIVVDIQGVTSIMTFGNLMTRFYPELVARHIELAKVAHARVTEQQLLTQIGALSTHVTGRTQRVGAVREVMMALSQATASYRNRHRIKQAVAMRAILPVWFLEVLRADLVLQHPGDGLEVFDIADAKIEGWFRSRNINVTWSMDGEAGQDYESLTLAGAGADGTLGLADYPTTVVWYLFVDGTFSFMDGGELDLGLVRDSTLNAANDYQMFTESFENVVKFGHESLRVVSPLVPTGQGTADTYGDAGTRFPKA